MASFEQITGAEQANQDEITRLKQRAIARALDLTKHRAAYRFGDSIGMLTIARYCDVEASRWWMAGAVVKNDGTIVTENHSLTAYGQEIPRQQPCGTANTHCGAYILPPYGSIKPIGTFSSDVERDDPFCRAYEFDDVIANAMHSHAAGIVDVPSEAREVMKTLILDADHSFAHPAIETLVTVALREL
ncbi:MAG TPA: hypothetical protein VLG11_03080 [Candidatus Saccharimonadales bacterium]|nr:hypothetical protein [Candidatus Saccharimonadales bacterium]